MLKKAKAMILSATMMITMASASVSAFANPASTYINNAIVVSTSYDATMDENVSMPRSSNPQVVSSWVSLNTFDWWSFWVEGSVHVKDGSTDYYHFSRAELWGKGAVQEKDINRWGWGDVHSFTDNFRALSWGFSQSDLTPRIFYGW